MQTWLSRDWPESDEEAQKLTDDALYDLTNQWLRPPFSEKYLKREAHRRNMKVAAIENARQRPHWIMIVIGLAAAVFSAIAAWPVIRGWIACLFG